MDKKDLFRIYGFFLKILDEINPFKNNDWYQKIISKLGCEVNDKNEDCIL